MPYLFSFAGWGGTLCGPRFHGRTIEAQCVEATDTEAVVMMLKSGRVYRLKIPILSDKDARCVATKRASMSEVEKEKAAEATRHTAMKKDNLKVVDFVLKNGGDKVGDGECWTLADEAFKAAVIKRLGKEWRIWGGVVNWREEDILLEGILELRSVKFSNG